jgi:hypothetical protein
MSVQHKVSQSGDAVLVACSKCDRRGQYPVARLIERYGREAKLVDLKDQIKADCPRRAKTACS